MTRAVIRTGGRGLTPVEHPADRHGDGFADPQPAVTFADELEHLPFDELLRVANDASSQRVAAALAAHPLELTLHDFAALLSRAAGERLPDIADASRRLTTGRFGRTMRMYAPLYLSNECLTTCAYCGFARELPIARKTLSPEETYHPETYGRVHLAGRKRHYRWRLLGPERAARAGMRRVGIGALFGLHDDWRYEALAVAAHARFLMKRYWRSQVTVSVPRMRPSAAGYQPRMEISDRELVQLICALRLLLPDVGIVISAREAAEFRDGLFQVGVTHTSAGSHTDPGGYEHPDEATEQFEVADTRSPQEVAGKLRELGYDPVWEDWSRVTPSAEAMLSRSNG